MSSAHHRGHWVIELSLSELSGHRQQVQERSGEHRSRQARLDHLQNHWVVDRVPGHSGGHRSRRSIVKMSLGSCQGNQIGVRRPLEPSGRHRAVVGALRESSGKCWVMHMISQILEYSARYQASLRAHQYVIGTTSCLDPLVCNWSCWVIARPSEPSDRCRTCVGTLWLPSGHRRTGCGGHGILLRHILILQVAIDY